MNFFARLFLIAGLILALPAIASASAAPCPRYAAGSPVVAPQDLYSSAGVLRVTFTYDTRVDASGNVLYCFMTADGVQSPTLHVKPGDELLISLTNSLPKSSTSSMPGMKMAAPSLSVIAAGLQNCGGMVMTMSSVNMHFHGTNAPPDCHQDEVIKTLINSGETFQYDVHFPLNEPPGLYWYHPHIHGISEPAVQGGASGAIIVDGLENVNPDVAGLPFRTLIIRDNLVPGNPDPNGNVPAWDISLNYAPITYPAYSAPSISMKKGTKELWRVLNASADTILNLQLQYDGVAQPFEVVGIDGVPTGSQDGTSRGKGITHTHFLMAPASRVELIATAPDASVKNAQLVTLNIDTGPDGDNDPARPLAVIKAAASSTATSLMPASTGGVPQMLRFSGLAKITPSVTRKLYFSEVLSDPNDPNSPTNFYITVDGATPTLFDPNNPPAIITHQGAVEDWIIENRALENHEFHIHQIHFLVVEKNGVPVTGQFRDMINVPYWSGKGKYPSVKLRMDFRGPDIGDFVYHCHILGHEDSGMMAIIRVLP